MYCLKCKYTSFDHLDTCPKCGHDWNETKKALNLDWLPTPPETHGTEQAAEQTEQYSEEELELNSDHFLLDNASNSYSEGQSSVPGVSPGEETDIEEIEYPEIDFEEPDEDLQLSNMEQEPNESAKQQVQSGGQESREEGPDITGEDSEDIAHPDLEQLLDSYSMDNAPDTGTSEAEQEIDSSGDFGEELELFGDLEMDEHEEEVSPESSNTDSEADSDQTGQESTSGAKKDEQDQKQEDEIDITSILDNPEDYWDGNKK